MLGFLGAIGQSGLRSKLGGMIGQGIQKATDWLGQGKNLQGLMGGATMGYASNKLDQNWAPQSEDAMRNIFKNTQGAIDRIGKWSNFSGAAADESTEAGNQAVRSALQSGAHGGSAALAIKNRMKLGQDTDKYNAWLKNQANVVQQQQGLDSNIFNAMRQDRGLQQNYRHGKYTGIGQMGHDILADSGFSTEDLFNKGAQGLGGLLRKIPGIK